MKRSEWWDLLDVKFKLFARSHHRRERQRRRALRQTWPYCGGKWISSLVTFKIHRFFVRQERVREKKRFIIIWLVIWMSAGMSRNPTPAAIRLQRRKLASRHVRIDSACARCPQTRITSLELSTSGGTLQFHQQGGGGGKTKKQTCLRQKTGRRLLEKRFSMSPSLGEPAEAPQGRSLLDPSASRAFVTPGRVWSVTWMRKHAERWKKKNKLDKCQKPGQKDAFEGGGEPACASKAGEWSQSSLTYRSGLWFPLRSLLNIVLMAWIHHLFLLSLVIVGVSVSNRCLYS